jgi:hypothetical protein
MRNCSGRASSWNHLICVPCWNKKNPDRMVLASDYTKGAAGACCYCGHATLSGIYVRDDPREVHGDKRS